MLLAYFELEGPFFLVIILYQLYRYYYSFFDHMLEGFICQMLHVCPMLQVCDNQCSFPLVSD